VARDPLGDFDTDPDAYRCEDGRAGTGRGPTLDRNAPRVCMILFGWCVISTSSLFEQCNVYIVIVVVERRHVTKNFRAMGFRRLSLWTNAVRRIRLSPVPPHLTRVVRICTEGRQAHARASHSGICLAPRAHWHITRTHALQHGREGRHECECARERDGLRTRRGVHRVDLVLDFGGNALVLDLTDTESVDLPGIALRYVS